MTAPIHRWTIGPLDDEVERALRRLADTPDVVHIAVMPDVHLADGVCVGCVTATTRTLLPAAVGSDIGCGMAALRFDGVVERLARDDAARLLGHMSRVVPVAQHPSAAAALPDALQRPLSSPRLDKLAASVGRVQHATLGRGNHFAELQRDEAGALWLMLHSGSRGIGQAIRDHHDPTRSGTLDAESPAGCAYRADLVWALDYARLARRRMVERVADGVNDVLGLAPEWATYRDCQHNHVRCEPHAGRSLWVHRKGAIGAADGEPGIIPGSMGSASHHVIGRGVPEALASSSHGAGRALARGAARRAISLRKLAAQTVGVWFDHRLADQLRDEAPGAYKDIGKVMRAQQALTRIERTLVPLLSYKGA